MTGVRYTQETLAGIPIPEDGVSFGKLSANGISTYIALRNIVFGGSYSFPTVSITLKGITNPPYSKPNRSGSGASFNFRGQSWTIIDVVEGAKFKIGDTEKFISWTVTGIDLSSGKVSLN